MGDLAAQPPDPVQLAEAQRAAGTGKPYCHRERAEAPVHIRLYQEKDDRRRRLEEARLRRLEQEEEDIRSAAQRAMGRATSPARCQSPSRDTAVHSPVPSRNATPPRMRPPLPDRPSSAGSHASHTSRRRVSGAGAGAGTGAGARAAAAAPAAVEGAVRGPAQQPPMAAVAEASEAELPVVPAAAQPLGPTASVPSPGSGAVADASSVASESGVPGMQSAASYGTLGGEESLCGDGTGSGVGASDDVQGLRQLVLTQQQRIEFLETMHQQALRQLRRAREELNLEQQRRYREADKVLGLEQLISEMQAQRFEGDAQMQLRWEEWLQRSRSILEAE